MIKVLLLDFYGVFLPDAYSAWLDKNNLTREGIYADLIERRDRGEINDTEFLKELSSAVGSAVTMSEIHKNSELNAELVGFVRELKTKYKIYLFSNASSKLREKLRTLGIDDLFDEVIISSEIGYAKPSTEAFTTAIERTGVKGSEILFIDDSLINIEAALKHGMWARHYESMNSFRDAVHLIK